MAPGREIEIAARVLVAKATGRRIPFFVQLMPTERCNLRCRYCYAEFGRRARPDFPLLQLLEVIDGLARLGTRVIMVAGGEPLLYRQIGAVIDRIAAHGIECSVNTNGVAVPDRIEELGRADMLSISLDGPPDLNDSYRGKGTYDKVLAAIRAARERSLRVQLQVTLTRDIRAAFDHVRGIAEEWGCFLGLNFLRPQQKVDGVVVEAVEAGDEEIRSFLRYLRRTLPAVLPYPRHLYDYVLSWPYSFGRHLIADPAELRGFRPIPCQAGRFLIAIDNAGDIFPCTKLFYTEPRGNCADGDIERAWRELGPRGCEACLDLGCNLMNDLFRLRPSAGMGLLRSRSRSRRRQE